MKENDVLAFLPPALSNPIKLNCLAKNFGRRMNTYLVSPVLIVLNRLAHRNIVSRASFCNKKMNIQTISEVKARNVQLVTPDASLQLAA